MPSHRAAARRPPHPRQRPSTRALPRTGRRPGTGGTREKILGAARSHFARVGYEVGTVRGIAAEAKVDPALVLHYFGSKRNLFRVSVDFPVDPAEFVPRL